MATVDQRKSVVVVGAGLVGCVLALGLKRRGIDVVVYERRHDPRIAGVSGGRSINLALSDRGMLALEAAGLTDDVESVAIAMPGRRMHGRDGSDTFMPYGLNGEAIRSVSRGGLNLALMTSCERAGVPIHFGHRCERLDLANTSITFGTDTGTVVVDAGVIAGADGAFSAVRGALLKTDRFDYSQSHLPHGYKELAIPAGVDGAFRFDKHALHIWPRSAHMMIALPNLDGTFTGTLFLAHDNDGDGDGVDGTGTHDSFASLSSPAAAREFFAREYPDALAQMPDFEAQWANNPVSSLSTVRCAPWVRHRTFLIGDAAHAIVPFFGQGMNAGFEDCRVLFDMLDAQAGTTDDVTQRLSTTVLEQFFVARKPHADAIATLALENFVEMREKVGQPAFLYRKRVEAAFARACPDVVTTAYMMVTFRPHLGYADALARGRALDLVLDTLVADDVIRRHLAGEAGLADQVAARFSDGAQRLRG